MRKSLILLGLVVAALWMQPPVRAWFVDGPLTNFLNLRGRTDENGYLRISKGATGAVDGPLTAMGNLRVRTNENGYLRVSCDDCGGAAGGSDTHVQFNDGGAFGGNSGFTYNKTPGALTLTSTNGVQSFSGAITGASGRGPNLVNYTLTDNTFGGFTAVRATWLENVLNFSSVGSGSQSFRGLNIYVDVPSGSQTHALMEAVGQENTVKHRTTTALGLLRATFQVAEVTSTATVTTLSGMHSGVTVSGAATITAMTGQSVTHSVTAGATITDQIVYNSRISNTNASMNATTAYFYRAQNIANTGTIGTTYGYYVGDITAGTQTNQAWAFYNSDANARSYFNGNSGFGSETTPIFAVDVGGGIALSSVLAISSTAPTISSGFGTTPSIAASNGTVAFTVDVGTGGTASSGVIGLPAATTGWICHVENRTGVAANRADQRTVQTATTTTTATVQNQTISTGAALAWTASDVLAVSCMGY